VSPYFPYLNRVTKEFAELKFLLTMSTTLKFIHKNIDCLKDLPRSGKALREHEVNIDPQFIRQKVWNSDPPCYVHYHRDLLQLIQEFLLDPVLFEDLSFNGMLVLFDFFTNNVQKQK